MGPIPATLNVGFKSSVPLAKGVDDSLKAVKAVVIATPKDTTTGNASYWDHLVAESKDFII